MTTLNNEKKSMSLATKMMISLVAGIAFGLLCMFFRESLIGSGKEAVWGTINNILFQDITAEGASSAIGLFYIIGQLFIRSLQVVIVPMVFTSIILAISQISDTKTLGRISLKTILTFLVCSFFALLLAGIVGMTTFKMGLFQVHVEGLEGAEGTTGANPLNVILNAIPSNFTNALTDNSGVLAIVFLAVAIGLCLNMIDEDKAELLKKFFSAINDIVVVFLNFIVTKFGPVAIFVLLSRTFATYGINYLRPALVYVVITTILLFVFLLIGYPLIIMIGAKVKPIPFVRKISNVAVFGFSTSSSAATLPMNLETCTKRLGVDDTIASFVLPLGMTINMNGTAIMQVIATMFIAGCGGYDITVGQLIIIALLALICSAGTPAAPGAGAIILFTILSGVGIVNDGALLAYTLILAINRPIEMLVTSLNVVGDAATSVIVSKSEGKLDEAVYTS